MNNSINQFERMESFLGKKYDFRYNVILGRVEYREKEAETFIALEDYKTNSMLRELKKAKINVSKSDIMQNVVSDLSPKYDPFKDYFNKLAKWNPEMPDYIKMLADTVKVAEEDRKIWETYLRKWLIATVSCATGKNTNQTVLVLIGEQGIGKTKWTDRLVPKKLNGYYYSGFINPDDKDTKVNLSECFLINLDELETLNRSELGSLKQLITQASIKVRRPYASVPEVLQRRASLLGSVNNLEFLKDETGNRRFLCVEAQSIDYEHTVDLDMVYAQAVYLLLNGEKYWFDCKENLEINLHNQKYKVQYEELEYVCKYFEPCLPNEEPEKELTLTELQKYLLDQEEKILNLNNRRLGMAMKASAFKRTKKNGLWYYKLKLKKQ